MVSFAAVISLIDPEDWYVAINSMDAFHVAIHPDHRKLQRFVGGGVHFQFIILPFGLSSTPQVFTKWMAVVAAYLHQGFLGISVPG